MAFLQADSPRPRRRRRRLDADAFEKAESNNALTTKTGIPEDAEREGRGKEEKREVRGRENSTGDCVERWTD